MLDSSAVWGKKKGRVRCGAVRGRGQGEGEGTWGGVDARHEDLDVLVARHDVIDDATVDLVVGGGQHGLATTATHRAPPEVAGARLFGKFSVSVSVW